MCSHRLTHITSGDSMKVASNSDRVTSMAAPRRPATLRVTSETGIQRSVSRYLLLHTEQNKAPARHRAPLRATHTTIVSSRCPVCPNTGFKLETIVIIKTETGVNTTRAHMLLVVSWVGFSRENSIFRHNAQHSIQTSQRSCARCQGYALRTVK